MTPHRVDIPADKSDPLVSIVIPVFNQWRYTNACLRTLASARDPAVATEVIVVDDGSTDRSQELLALCTGIRLVHLESNRGFVAACNTGARAARGTYLYFLNNDAFVTKGWIRPLLDAFLTDPNVGAAVSQLRYPDDTISEAGGVIWSDGRGSNYGRGGSPRDWRYCSPRDVDYGSAASLMVRRADFLDAGGFSGEFAPAYYEDADLCFALRSRGYRVVYRPDSVVYHTEGVSYGSNARDDALALQERNRRVFAGKWSDELRAHLAPDSANVETAARRLAGKTTVVVADEHVPFTDRDAGSRRIFFLMELLRKRGWHVIFGSIDRAEYQPYTDALRANGTEVICGFSPRSVNALKRWRIPVDVAWLCRPGPAARLSPAFRAAGQAKFVFDTVDLHYLRLEREQHVTGRRTCWEAMRQRELDLAQRADAVVATSSIERELLAASGVARVYELPVIEPVPAEAPPPWEARRGLVFLGNYTHAPNVDAARWLCGAVMPLVWARLPGLRLTLAGADPTRAVRALARDGIVVAGYVAEAAALLNASRVFVAPLRYGAGIKGKIVYALAHGIPVVTTPVGAEGIFDLAEYGAVASTPEELAALVVRLHEDRAAWEALSRAGLVIAERFSPAAVHTRLGGVLEQLYTA
jgi:GT2 family glycosyltransferase/glycosyltransferase involved in cell wall biosynthesis